MRNLSGLFRSRDKPQNRTAGSGYTFFLGGSSSGKAVTERSAMQMTAVYSCVRILSEAVAGLPLHLYRYIGSGGKEKAIDHPLYRLLHDEPNPEMSSFVFRETLMTHLLLWGNAYSQIIRNGKGEIIALYPLMPNKMTVDRDESGRLYYSYQRSNDEAIGESGRVILKPSEVLHIPGLGFDGLVGYSPIAMAKNAIGLAIATEEYGAKFFANGAAPSGVLEHPGTLKDPSKIREAWQSQFGGSQNSGKVAVLEEGMKYTPISISPEQAQFLETRKFQINEIARIFRVPPHMVGDLEKSSFSNIEQQSLEFVKYTLDPWVVRWEQSIMRTLLSPTEKNEYFVKFNLEGLLRGDYQSRMNGYAIGRQNGWMSANDIRELENLDLIPDEDGGNLYLVNGNMLPIKSIAKGNFYTVQPIANNDVGKEDTDEKSEEVWNWKNQADVEGTHERVLEFYGTIAEESWFDDDITPKMFREELFADKGPVTIWINSPGGDCNAASQIYAALMDYKDDVTVKIDGMAASAASVIAMAGTKVLMAPTAMMMIHNPSTGAFGDHKDMEQVIEMLDEVKESIINAYEIRTGLSHAQLSHMMDSTTWMNAKKAVELGFADEMLTDSRRTPVDVEAYAFSAKDVEQAVVNKIIAKVQAKKMAESPKPEGRKVSDLMERLDLLKY